MQYADIESLDKYNKRMAQSILDKAFFLDKVNADVIVDFGCANGDLLAFISHLLPHNYESNILVGYDNDPAMIELAKERLANIPCEHFLFSDWDKMIDFFKNPFYDDKRICLGLSSVLHEIYHYSSPVEIDNFWKQIWSCELFDNIVIRDMLPSMTMERLSDINHVASLLRDNKYTSLLEDFQKHHGSIQSNKNLIHFLMKYKYKEPNWQREVKENYFPLYYESLLALLPSNYEIIFENHYKLPHIWRNIKKDFGINLKDNTHLQLILEKI